MTSEELFSLVNEGLGNSAYLLDLGDGRGLAVDPPLDLRALRGAADRRGLRVAFVADTHLHADFLTGARQLAVTDNATILASAAGQRGFDHRGLTDGEEIDLGGLTLRALATPGHTDEHLSFLLLDDAKPVGVFTGGSLIVGSAARTDLMGNARAEELARAQYDSLHRLAALPDATAVWPTHGAGSFCSAPAGAERITTIGHEKATNGLLGAPDADAFIARLLGGLGSYPAYFSRLAEINRRGPELVPGDVPLVGLTVSEVRRLLAEGAVAVDVRPAADVTAGHLPGAISIPLRAQFATWLGWLIDPGIPIVIIRNPDQNPADIVWPALNIGFDRIVGELSGGMNAWIAAEYPVSTIRLVRPDQIAGEVLDVRQTSEYVAGHLPGAGHIELGDLPQRVRTTTVKPAVVMCASGVRALTAASILQRAGHHDVAVLIDSAAAWARSTGRSLEEGA
ncbi:MAG: MBL fold metallo-hydrolase [Longispora sp.]|nr:MBL fold metallo-hydrolase [Longispora sp. (in: high G+C Gram-positive bacteria)]